MKSKNEKRNGLNFTGVLALIFIALKLCNVINWSWVWVLSPLWISLIIVLILSVIYIILRVKESK